MSRICVKSLPKYVKEDLLREFFSQKGEVTDAKLMHTSDGKSRQFAFIGFRTEKEAQEALRYFNNTYMDTCKITCEVACKVGDSTIPQPWSRHSLKKEITLCKNKSKSKDTKPSKLERSKGSSDPKLQEFLHVTQPRAKSKIWENDMTSILEQETKTEEKFFKKKNSSEAIVDDTTRLPIEVESIADMDYFKSRVRQNWSDSESGSISGSKSEELLSGSKLESESESDSRHRDGESESEKKLALDTGRLFIRNLRYTTTEDELCELFGQYGDLSQVHILVDRDTRRSKGICFVLFTSPESAVRALEELTIQASKADYCT